ncbi:Intein/homing endonuclease [Halapricum desulfuricans]|uniref:Intein/homing endonuclease n=1 Tax=Halapricum desulfuricans TaxID=2841257 RepID=A0A897NRN9_9EURY|nr:Intein/homing endonuclease [Halapricum desulfuricans]
MILSDADIVRRLENGDLVVEPLDDPDIQIQPASVDLRLGREFLEFQRTNIPSIHPNSEQEVEEYVEETVVEDGEEFILHPGDFVLGTTYERVEIPPDLIAHVEGRSSLGRLAIVVHASLPHDEEVFLWTPTDGFGFYEIGDIVENERPARAVAFDPQTLRVSTHRVTDYITNPTQRIYRVTLDSGRQVHVTKDHNLFTLDRDGGVTRIPSEDAEGTQVMVPKQLPRSPTEQRSVDILDHVEPTETTLYATDGFGWVDAAGMAQGSERHYDANGSAPMEAVPKITMPDDVEVAFRQSDYRLPRELPLTREFGWMLGFYIAEGSARRKQIQVANTERQYLTRFREFFEQYDASISIRETDRLTRLTICSALWSAVIRSLSGAGSEKTIPTSAFSWPRDTLEGLLEGLLDGDGCRRDERDTFYTANEELANKVMYLAARLGKVGSLYSRERKQYIEMSDVEWEGEMWSVDVSGERHKRGQYVPVPSRYLRELRKQAGLTMDEAAELMGYSSKSSISNVENEEYDTIKRDTLRRFCDAYSEAGVDTARLDQILDGGVRFEEVVSVEETERVEPTYDLEVQPNGKTIENFLGGRGGVFLSNTAGLCDPGYKGQITLELSNLGTAPVALSPGMRISQLTFTELKSPADRPYGEERGSKYQDQEGPQASKIQGDREFGGDQ